MHNIKNDGSDFETGTTKDNHQVIIGLLCPHLVAYFFSTEGDFLSRVEQLWHYPPPRIKVDGPFQIYNQEFRLHLDKQLAEWKNELGFIPQTIQIKSFFDQANSVGTQEMRDYLSGSDDNEEEAEKKLQAHENSGHFIFYWAKDYIMSVDGEAVSS